MLKIIHYRIGKSCNLQHYVFANECSMPEPGSGGLRRGWTLNDSAALSPELQNPGRVGRREKDGYGGWGGAR